MDGNEKNLPPPRVGIGDVFGQRKAGVPSKIDKEANKRSLASAKLVTPGKLAGSTMTMDSTSGSIDKAMANAIQVGKKRSATDQVQVELASTKTTKKKNSEPSLKEMMERMKNGRSPDGNSQDITGDEDMARAEDVMDTEGWSDDEALLDDQEMETSGTLLETTLTTGQRAEAQLTDEHTGEPKQTKAQAAMQKTDFIQANRMMNQSHGTNTTTNTELRTLETSTQDERSKDTTGINTTTTPILRTTMDLTHVNRLVNQPTGATTTAKHPRTTPTPICTRNGVDLMPLYKDNVTTIRTLTFEERCLKRDPNSFNKRREELALSNRTTPVKASQSTEPETATLKVAPESNSKEPSQKFFTYTFELTFHEPLTNQSASNKKSKNFNVPDNFRQFFRQLRIASPDVLLQPYNSSGPPITSEDQLPEDDIETYNTYYHNHTISPTGKLTGQCLIMVPHTWTQLKNVRTTFFKWLLDKKVFMKPVAFKVDQLSAAGWVYGLHPDLLRKDEAIPEFRKRLGSSLPTDVLFQLTPRFLSIAEQQGGTKRFTFKAIAVECDKKNVKLLQEALYQLGNPMEEKNKWGITGRAMSVPFVSTEAWQHKTILGMAKAHVKEMDKLGQIFLRNLQDIDKQLQDNDKQPTNIRKLLLNLRKEDSAEIFHSVHNTNRDGVVTALYYKAYASEAEDLLSNVHYELEAAVHEDCYGSLSQPGTRIEITGRQNQVDSSNAKVYATYAEAFLENPQGGDEDDDVEPLPPLKKQKNRSPPKMTYSAVASKPPSTGKKATTQSAHRSTNTSANHDDYAKLYEADSSSKDSGITTNNDSKWSEIETRLQERMERMEEHFEDQYGKMEGLTVEQAEIKIAESHARLQEQTETFLNQRFEEFTLKIAERIADETAKLKQSFLDDVDSKQEYLFNRFEALHQKQTAMIVSKDASHEKRFDIIFQELTELKQALQAQRVATKPGTITTASGEGT